MEKSKKTILSKILKITGITFAISLLAFVLLPIIFADTITEKVKANTKMTLVNIKFQSKKREGLVKMIINSIIAK